MLRQKLFDNYRGYETIEGFIRAKRRIEESLTPYNPSMDIEQMQNEDLDNIIFRCEKMALSARYALEKRERSGIFSPDFSLGKYAENNPCRVTFDGKTLRVFTPYTFKRFYRDKSLKENYLLMNYVRAALLLYEEEHNMDFFRCMKAPFIYMIVRKAMRFSATKICDHDNLENGRIINEIFNRIGYSDNPIQTNMYSTFHIVSSPEEEGMEFVVFPKPDIMKHLDEF